jgi:predicted anti-sigma-YlaC factor YlaD
MRHIPEAELHAYLDQSLSRSQCVEIESHLADCPACRRERDDIAALRDRTTAMLARLAPPRGGIAPAFEELAAEASLRTRRRRSGIRIGAWAASVAAAMVLGYSASSWLHERTRREFAAGLAVPVSAPALDTAPALVAVAPPAAPSTSKTTPRQSPPAHGRRAASALALTESTRLAPLADTSTRPVELSSQLLASADQADFSGIWRTVSWERARSETGTEPARIDGLPVMQVQVQQARESKKPIMVVAQQLQSGEMIRTIEGPVNDVSELLAHRGPAAPAPASLTPQGAPINTADGVMAMQRGDQLLAVTGRLPSDSLRAMIRRLNAAMRASGQ